MLERLLLRAHVQHKSVISCNKTELNRNSKTEMRWNKKEVSLSSPDLREILRPRSERNWRASLFMGPRDSKAIGWKQYWLSSAPYLVLLWVAAISATSPAEPIAVWCRNWLLDRPPSRPSTGACLPATESKSVIIIIIIIIIKNEKIRSSDTMWERCWSTLHSRYVFSIAYI